MKLFLLVSVCFMSLTTFAADPPTTGGAPEWMKYTTPSTEHKNLQDFAGKWKFTMTWWMDAKATGEKSTGTSTNKMILGGRFLQQDVTSKSKGQTFTGLGFTGFDLVKGEYQTVWLDSMSTAMMTGAGTWDSAADTMKTTGSVSCPMTGNKNMAYRTELKKVSKTEHTFTMFTTGTDGAEFKSMEINYKKG